MRIGPFGSQCNNSGPRSLNSLEYQKDDRMYKFEIGSSSSGSSTSSSQPGSRRGSMIGFGMESKKFEWTVGSERKSKVDWDRAVDSVFKEEIGKMIKT